MTQYRIETDSLGEVKVPEGALYQAQTQRAIDNFPFSGRPLPIAFHQALIQIKQAAAMANHKAGKLSSSQRDDINRAAEQALSGKYDDQFCVDIFQTGSGTSTNMNVNEVLASLASSASGERIHPNDHVNASQSSNDTIPSALQLSVAKSLQGELLPAMEQLISTLTEREALLNDEVKTGRTHLMDAMPVTLSQELATWRYQIEENRERLHQSLSSLCALPIGGTAVGTGVNCPENFDAEVCRLLADTTALPITPCANKSSRMASQDVSVSVSGHLNTLAVSLMKIANDLRWMNSGPLNGLSEIELQALQPGSSIMPGKVNPVIPEAVTMICARVMGHHSSTTIAGQSGNFQLNVMLPLIADNLLDSITLLANVLPKLSDTIEGFTVNSKQLSQAVGRNPVLVTALNDEIGYEAAAKIAKQALKEERSIIDVAMEHTDLSEEQLRRLLDPKALT